MKFSVIELRNQGIRRTREEIAAAVPAIGELEIEDWLGPNAEKRPIRRANVYERISTQDRGMLVPLFEPQLIRMNKRWFILNGWQITVVGRACVHYHQEWLVQPVG